MHRQMFDSIASVLALRENNGGYTQGSPSYRVLLDQ